ncbi:PliI family lysozyme inhibitor of I-type lysozyme [Pseudoduganella sp. R-31]|uniref:PliI family lysozyme inhibitor of I-type lysozyme n=1 Tax=unclassified Pseudoduganella TaxID=2637179 RepID=UPI003CECC5ED
MRSCKLLAFAGLLALSNAACRADDSGRVVRKLAVGRQYTAVVAEGDCEARSIGSYSVRLYSSAGAAPGDDTVFYEAGLVLPRDGSVEKIMLDRLDGKADSLIVIMRSAGSGSFLAADAFSVAHGKLALRASVGGLSPQADPITVLRAALSRRRR